MIDTNKLLYGSMFSGFSNDKTVSFSASYGGGTLASGSYAGPVRASVALANSNDISQILVNISGLETFYRLLNGVFQVNYPNSSATTYSIEIFSYFKGGKLYVDSYIINQGGSVTIPAITFKCVASTFIAPF